jgi:methyl-accepting chemotaxis protein
MMSQHSELTPHQKDVLVYGFNQLVGQSFLIAAGVFLVVGAVALYFSKKILGPIYRVEKWSRFQLQSNSIETLVVRKSDELSQVSESLNRKIEKIKELV